MQYFNKIFSLRIQSLEKNLQEQYNFYNKKTLKTLTNVIKKIIRHVLTEDF